MSAARDSSSFLEPASEPVSTHVHKCTQCDNGSKDSHMGYYNGVYKCLHCVSDGFNIPYNPEIKASDYNPSWYLCKYCNCVHSTEYTHHASCATCKHPSCKYQLNRNYFHTTKHYDYYCDACFNFLQSNCHNCHSYIYTNNKYDNNYLCVSRSNFYCEKCSNFYCEKCKPPNMGKCNDCTTVDSVICSECTKSFDPNPFNRKNVKPCFTLANLPVCRSCAKARCETCRNSFTKADAKLHGYCDNCKVHTCPTNKHAHFTNIKCVSCDVTVKKNVGCDIYRPDVSVTVKNMSRCNNCFYFTCNRHTVNCRSCAEHTCANCLSSDSHICKACDIIPTELIEAVGEQYIANIIFSYMKPGATIKRIVRYNKKKEARLEL